MNLPIHVVIMAAGKGTRMKSSVPKILQKLAGRALIGHVLASVAALRPRTTVVVCGHGADRVQAACRAMPIAHGVGDLHFVVQQPQLGTGHAVQQAAPALPDEGITLVLNGDVPLVQSDTLRRLIDACADHRLALLTVDEARDAGAYGRIVRADGGGGASVRAIVEAKDASPEQLAITEWYSGAMAAPTHVLKKYLAQLTNNNAQGEFYLTDVVGHAVADGASVDALTLSSSQQVSGINNAHELAQIERRLQQQHAYRLMDEYGVRLADPARFDLRDDTRHAIAGELICGPDVEIDVGCVFHGRVQIDAGVSIGAYCVIANANIGAGTVIRPFTHIDGEQQGVRVGPNAQIGPYARLRPGTELAADVHIGNFVEVKNSRLGAGSKANHLAYLGDADVGERVNVGAGVITANYDGVNKHRTVIESDAQIGSNSVLVAPVTIGARGVVGAGSVITENTLAETLSVTRGRQVSIKGWKRSEKKP